MVELNRPRFPCRWGSSRARPVSQSRRHRLSSHALCACLPLRHACLPLRHPTRPALWVPGRVQMRPAQDLAGALPPQLCAVPPLPPLLRPSRAPTAGSADGPSADPAPAGTGGGLGLSDASPLAPPEGGALLFLACLPSTVLPERALTTWSTRALPLPLPPPASAGERPWPLPPPRATFPIQMALRIHTPQLS